MPIILSYLYIIFIVVTMFLLVKDRKNSKKNITANKGITSSKKDKKIALIIVLSTMFIYYIIGHIFKTNIFNAITLRKNGVTFSFVGIILLFITVIIIGRIIDFIRKSKRIN